MYRAKLIRATGFGSVMLCYVFLIQLFSVGNSFSSSSMSSSLRIKSENRAILRENTGSRKRIMIPKRMGFKMSSENLNSNPRQRGLKGYYRRPSKAIEDGGGFFIPGLEGEKIRIISSVLFLVLLAVNHATASTVTTAQWISDIISFIISFLLLLQGASSLFRFDGQNADVSVSSYLTIIQKNKGFDSMILDSTIRALAQTCSEINYILVLSAEGVVLEFGPVSGEGARKVSANLFKVVDPFTIQDLTTFLSLHPYIPIPAGSSVIASITDKRGWVWLVSSANAEELKSSEKWLVSLVNNPI